MTPFVMCASPLAGLVFEGSLLVTGRALRISGSLRNASQTPVFVFDQPWRLDDEDRPMVDPERAFRSAKDGVLRVLLGSPPMPSGRTVVLQLTPLASRVAPGGARAVDLALPLPVAEYNPYFPSVQRFRDATASSVELVVQFARERPETVIQRVPWGDAEHVSVIGAGSVHRPDSEVLRAVAPVQDLPVRLAIGDFARLVLGDEPPGPALTFSGGWPDILPGSGTT